MFHVRSTTTTPAILDSRWYHYACQLFREKSSAAKAAVLFGAESMKRILWTTKICNSSFLISSNCYYDVAGAKRASSGTSMKSTRTMTCHIWLPCPYLANRWMCKLYSDWTRKHQQRYWPIGNVVRWQDPASMNSCDSYLWRAIRTGWSWENLLFALHNETFSLSTATWNILL